MTILEKLHGSCLVITFNHVKTTNPFSGEMMDTLMAVLERAESDDRIDSIVLYGGENRSFSAGGDFAEVIKLGDWENISAALHQIVDLYASIIKVTKPIVSAIDNYAIGMGFQIALLTDYRVSTSNAKFLMPELKNGIACTLGGILLEVMLGRKIMMDICYNCEKLSIEYCQETGIVNEINDDVLARAIEMANYYGSFPNDAFKNTKYVNNIRYLEQLESVRELTVNAHYKTLTNKKHIQYMASVLKES